MISESKGWYARQFRRMIRIALFFIVLSLISLILNVIQFSLRSDPVYFALTSGLRLNELHSANEKFSKEASIKVPTAGPQNKSPSTPPQRVALPKT
jgi:hypothetical protein